MKSKNIVLFSSGITEKNGLLTTIGNVLCKKGYTCSYWRSLFAGANDPQNIALLPILIKKIPTFDYAVLICEGHDDTVITRKEAKYHIHTMRDNVLFEIGLCTMALGLSKIILVADEFVHIPDDLIGCNNNLAIKKVIYKKADPESHLGAADSIISYLDNINGAVDEIDEYIKQTENILTPVVIGAASSTACGYVNNFIFRTLEHINDGILFNGAVIPVNIKKLHMHILIPDDYSENSTKTFKDFFKDFDYGCVKSARHRPVNINFKTYDDEIHIYDIPTTIGTSYETANMILEINADDIYDPLAAKRFMQKEINLFEATVKSLVNEKFLNQIISENYHGLDSLTINALKKRVLDVINSRFFIEHI